jgi:hypothetical protein
MCNRLGCPLAFPGPHFEYNGHMVNIMNLFTTSIDTSPEVKQPKGLP